MQKKRLFIAIDLPGELTDKIGEFQRYTKGVKWVKPEQIHLTLNFLGNTPYELTEQLKAKIKDIRFQKFSLKLNDCGFFPNEYRPSVFWIGLEENSDLIQLKINIDEVLNSIGIICEKRRFIPHITLARIKRKLSADNLLQLKSSAQKIRNCNFEVNKFILFSSKLTEQGAIHNRELIVHQKN